MTIKAYAFAKGQPKRLQLETNDKWNTTTVRLDGQIVAAISDKDTLTEGVNIVLTDGAKLDIRKINSVLGTEFAIEYNGQALYKTMSDVAYQIYNACWVLFFVAAVNIAFGLFGANFLEMRGYYSAYTLGFGIVFAALGLWTMLTSSKTPLGIGLGILVLDSFIMIMAIFSGVERISTLTGLGLRAIIILYIWRAIDAITYQPDPYYNKYK